MYRLSDHRGINETGDYIFQYDALVKEYKIMNNL